MNKTMFVRRILKEIGVMLIVVAMILSAVVATVDAMNDQPSMFSKLDTDYITHPQTNMFDDDWIHFDDGVNDNAVAHSSGSYEGAIRITSDELGGCDGWNPY